jgi:hypothetical protein
MYYIFDMCVRRRPRRRRQNGRVAAHWFCAGWRRAVRGLCRSARIIAQSRLINQSRGGGGGRVSSRPQSAPWLPDYYYCCARRSAPGGDLRDGQFSARTPPLSHNTAAATRFSRGQSDQIANHSLSWRIESGFAPFIDCLTIPFRCRRAMAMLQKSFILIFVIMFLP